MRDREVPAPRGSGLARLAAGALARGLAVGALALATGCGPRALSPSRPRVTMRLAPGQVLGLGEPIALTTSWQGSCAVTSKDDEVTGEEACGAREHRVEIACDGPCEREPFLAAMAGGRFAFTVRLVAADGEASPVHRSPTVDIHPPDGLALYCYYPELDAVTDAPGPPTALVPCDDRPLAAATPWVQVRARLGDRSYRTFAAALDGRRGLTWEPAELGDGFELVTSLAEVLAAPGAALAPGRHQVRVTLGAQQLTVSVAVAP